MLKRHERPGALGRAVRNLGWLLTGKGVGAVLSLVYLGLATRLLGPERFGQFVLILGVGQGIAALAGFETWQIVVRYGAGPVAAGDRDALSRLVALCVTLDIVAALVGCGIAVGGILLFGARLGLPPSLGLPAMLLCAAMLLSIRSTAVGILRLIDRFGAGAAADASTSVARLLGTLAAVAAGVSVRGFLIAWSVAELVTACVYWTTVARTAPGLRLLPGVRRVRRALRENPGILRYAAITSGGATLNGVGKQLAVLIVGAMAGTAAAGAYRLAYQLAQALARVSEMFARALFAEFAKAHVAAASGEAAALFRQTLLAASLCGVAIVAVLLLGGRPLLLLVAGHAYAAAYPLMLLLGCAAALDVAGVGFEPALMAMGRSGLAFGLRLLVTALLLVGLYAGCHMAGATGAAWAMLAASALALPLFGRAAWRNLHARDRPAQPVKDVTTP